MARTGVCPDVPDMMCTEVVLNEEDTSYMFDDTTPVKDCGEFQYNVSHSGCVNKEPVEVRDASSQLKRRRMLQFDNQVAESFNCCEEMSSTFLRSSEREDSLEEAFTGELQWASGFSEDISNSSFEGLDSSSESWVAECLNDMEMHLSADHMNFLDMPDVQIGISDYDNMHANVGMNTVQPQVTRSSPNVIIKGRKSFLRTPSKIVTSVAYPFAFVKPCGMQGDVTLKDINQRIRTPPPLSSKQTNEDLSVSYPTSAFSGKPVVGKTRIRTEGGKGSITIMRTKGRCYCRSNGLSGAAVSVSPPGCGCVWDVRGSSWI